MSNRIGGDRRKTRRLMTKAVRARGKVSLSSYLASYKPGEKVVLYAEPAVQGGCFNLRFQGRMAVITGRRGECYEVTVNDQNKPKNIVVHPVHLKPQAKAAAKAPAAKAAAKA
jgi:large subunit ribosomal protein L21e